MEIFKLLGKIAIDHEDAMAALDETGQKAEDTSNKTQSAFGKIGTVAGTIGKAVLGAGIALGGAWVAAIEGTREYRTHLGMLDTAFQMSGLSAGAARQTYSELNAVLGDSGQATEAAQHLAKLADNEEELSTLTNILTGVYATFGESLPLEGLAEGINHSAKLGEVQGSLADALEWSGITVEDFNKKLEACSTEQERQDLIVNTLNDTYSKAGKQYKETNKDVLEANKAQEKLTHALAELGRVGEPILTAIKTKVAQMATAAVPHIENFVNKVKDLKKWIKDNQTTINNWKAAIVGTAASVASFVLILKWGAIMSAASTAIKGVTLAVKALNLAMKANIIGLIVSLVIGLVAAFITLWKNNEQFRAFWINLWAKIKSACGIAVDWIKQKFNSFKDMLKSVKNSFGNIKDAIGDKLDEARKKVSSVIDKIKGFFPLKIGKIFSNLKIPKITVSGGKAPFGIAGKGSLPSFNVKWNAEGAILKRPTIFGRDANGQLQGGGEAGTEAVAPIETLQTYIRQAVREDDEAIIRTLIEQNRLLMDFLARIMPSSITLDSGALVGTLTPAIDMRLADRWNHAARGNTR